MRVHLATDHRGFELKEKVKKLLLERGSEVKDHGAFELDKKDDYPDFIGPAAQAVSENPSARAIIFGGSGQGEAMLANSFENVRAAVWYGGEQDVVRLSREDNDANVLSIGARFVDENEAMEMIKLWLELPFSGADRHKRRLGKWK